MVLRLLALLGVIAAVAIMATAASSRPVQAQQPDAPPLADLSLASEPYVYQPGRRHGWRITVRNNLVGDAPGTTVATVKVRVVIDDGVNDPVTEVHTVRDLPFGQGAPLSFEFPNIATGGCTSFSPSSPVLSRIHATIIETDPLEPPGLRFNNSTENVGLSCPETAFTDGDTGVRVNISDRSPQPGGATTFTVIAKNFPGPSISTLQDDDVQFDVQVKISLSRGLRFDADPQHPSGTAYDPATGIWGVGRVVAGVDGAKSLPVTVRLTADSLADIPLEERCLTAEVVRAKPWFAWDGSKRQNDIYTACLGKITVLLTHGDVDLFHYLDCVGVTTAPCTSEDKLELVARRPIGSTAPEIGTAQPDELIVQIGDPEGRHGSTITSFQGTIWSTGTPTTLDAPQVEGVGVSFQFFPSGWDRRYRWTISDVSPKQRPGAVKIIFGSRHFLLLDADAKKTLAGNVSRRQPAFVAFGALGTYKISLDVGATKSGTAYSDTVTYTFHVGPMADLEVRDAGADFAVAASRRAYTIMALNNGPDTPQDVKVTLTGVPEGAEAITSQGTYSNGVWTIGEIGPADTRRASGHAGEGATLTLITGDPVPPDIKANIKNTGNYSVVIDDTTHTTHYYDHVSRNNKATITARAGTGQPHPDAPTGLNAMEAFLANILTWDEVKRVNGHQVSHYEVQRAANSWETLEENVKGTVYADMDPQPGRPVQYRVRAVNVFDVPGPWSSPAGIQSVAGPQEVSAQVIGDNQAVEVTWAPPVSLPNTGAATQPIIGYRVQKSDGGADWEDAAVAVLSGSATVWIDLSLPPNVARRYRVQAIYDDGGGPWSDPSPEVMYASPVTGDPVPDTGPASMPPISAALVVNSAGDLNLDIWWDGHTLPPNPMTPPDPDSDWWTVVEYRERGGPWWYGDETQMDQSRLPRWPNQPAIRQGLDYEVRACRLTNHQLNDMRVSRPEGDWCRGLSTSTARVSGGSASHGAGEGDGENVIKLSWTDPEDNGPPITDYRIEHSTDGGTTGALLRARQSGTSYRHTGMQSGTTHHYRVAAINPVPAYSGGPLLGGSGRRPVLF